MIVELRLTINQELELLKYDLKRWYELFPYEQDYVIRRTREITVKFSDQIGSDLTKDLLTAISKLDIAR